MVDVTAECNSRNQVPEKQCWKRLVIDVSTDLFTQGLKSIFFVKQCPSDLNYGTRTGTKNTWYLGYDLQY